MGTGAYIICPQQDYHGDGAAVLFLSHPDTVFTGSSVGGLEDNESRNVRKVNLFIFGFDRQTLRTVRC